MSGLLKYLKSSTFDAWAREYCRTVAEMLPVPVTGRVNHVHVQDRSRPVTKTKIYHLMYVLPKLMFMC